MSLQTRLASFITAVGADIKALQQRNSGANIKSSYQPGPNPAVSVTGGTAAVPIIRELPLGTTKATVSITTSGGALVCEVIASVMSLTATAHHMVGVRVDGVDYWNTKTEYFAAANQTNTIAYSETIPVSAGAHTVVPIYKNANTSGYYQDLGHYAEITVTEVGGVIPAATGVTLDTTQTITAPKIFNTTDSPSLVPLTAKADAASTTDSLRVKRGSVDQLRVDRYNNTLIGETTSILALNNVTYMGTNTYFDGSNWRYLIDGTAFLECWNSFGTKIAYQAVSGLAGDPVTWLELDAAQGKVVRRLTADQTVTGTTLTDSIVSNTIPGGSWAFEVNGFYRGSTTAQGLRCSISAAGGTITDFIAGLMAPTSAVATNSTMTTTNGGALGSGTASLTTALPFQITGSVVLGAAGTIRFRFASHTTGGIIVSKGSYMRLMRIQN